VVSGSRRGSADMARRSPSGCRPPGSAHVMHQVVPQRSTQPRRRAHAVHPPGGAARPGTPASCNSPIPLRSCPARPDLERDIQRSKRRREHHRRARSRLPEHDQFRVGHLHASSSSYAAVIDDVEHREARSAIRCLRASMVCGTDLLLGLVMTPSEDCVLSGIRLPFEVKARLCPAARAGRCLILVQKCVARQRRTRHLPSGGAAAPRLFDRITVAGAPGRDQGVRPTRRKLVNRHDRGGAPATVPGTHAAKGGQTRRLDTRPDHRRYPHTGRHRQSSGGLDQHRQDPLIMLVRRSTRRATKGLRNRAYRLGARIPRAGANTEGDIAPGRPCAPCRVCAPC
jgi:hypothetical protein